jgi:hypothetical protein
VGEHHLVAEVDDGEHAVQAAFEVLVVLLDRAFLARLSDGVAAEGDDGAAAVFAFGQVQLRGGSGF